jgi:hypothetical protein
MYIKKLAVFFSSSSQPPPLPFLFSHHCDIYPFTHSVKTKAHFLTCRRPECVMKKVYINL